MERKGEDSPVYEIKPETGVGRRRVIHRNLLLPCDDLPFEVRQDKICRKPKRVSRRSKSSKTAPDSSRESSSDEDPDGILTFTPLQDKGMREPQVSNPTSEAASDLPANHQVPHEETSNGADAVEFQEPAEPVVEPSEENHSDIEETQERPSRQRRAPTLFTYDTLGTPSFHHPAGLGTANHIAGVMPLSIPVVRGTVGGLPNTWLNCVWPWGYPAPYGHVGAYPYWTN